MNLNISFTDLMKKFSKKRGGSKPAKSAKVFSPESVWKNILISFTIVNVLVVAWSAYLFFFVKPADLSLGRYISFCRYNSRFSRRYRRFVRSQGKSDEFVTRAEA
jgi:hypothetical protein